MSTPQGAMMPAFFDFAQQRLADLLLRKIWSPETSAHDRKVFLSQFLKANYQLNLDLPPVIGVAVSEWKEGMLTIDFLSTVPDEAFTIPNLLQSLALQNVPYHITRTGRIRACSRPARGGDSIGHQNGETGTFGCVVRDQNGTEFILSCNHVIAALNSGQPNRDEIWQPGRKDKGGPPDRIGVLHSFCPIVPGRQTGNLMDAAIGRPYSAGDVEPGIRSLGQFGGYEIEPQLGLRVTKEGTQTHVTRGVLRMKNVSAIISYENGTEALYDQQLGIIGVAEKGRFAEQGDSGAVLIDESRRAVGLLFAVSEGVDVAFANPIGLVLDHFGVTLC
jgi:hypothetical protein